MPESAPRHVAKPAPEQTVVERWNAERTPEEQIPKVHDQSCANTNGNCTKDVVIHALLDRATAANNAGDIDGWVALFEDGAIYMPPGSPEVTTVDGLRETATAGFTRFNADIRILPTELAVLGDWAFGRSQVTGSVTPKAGGDSIPIDMKQLTVYHRRDDGTWRIARLINNSNRE